MFEFPLIIIAFVILIAILLVKPSGLFGRHGGEKV